MGKKTGRARGRPSRIPDAQTKFLAEFWSSWDDARAGNDRTVISSFYNDVATQFLQKFGPPVPRTAEEGFTESDTPNAVSEEPTNNDPTFDINALDPRLRNIGPNNTTVSHGQVTFQLSPPDLDDSAPSTSTSTKPTVHPVQPSKNDWGRTRSVRSLIQSSSFYFSLTLVDSSLWDGLTITGRKTPKPKFRKPAWRCSTPFPKPR